MKRLSTDLIVACVVLAGVTPVWGRLSMPQIRWLKNGHLDIPAQVREAKAPTDLAEALNNKRSFIRAAAVRRLGELRGSDAIDQLIQILHSEKPVTAQQTWPVVKIEVIRTIGRMEGEQASQALASLLGDHWDQGPVDPNDRSLIWLKDTCPVIHVILKEAYARMADESMSSAVEEVATSEQLGEMFARFRGGIGDLAWMAYANGLMMRAAATEETARARYLMQFRRQALEQKDSDAPLAAIKLRAAHAMLNKCDLSALKVVLDELWNEMEEKSPYADSDAEYDSLRSDVTYLGRLITLRLEEQSRSNEPEDSLDSDVPKN